MTDTTAPAATGKPYDPVKATEDKVLASLKGRYAAERRFRAYGVGAIAFAMFTLALLFYTIFSTGISAFWQTNIRMDVHLDEQVIDPKGTRIQKDIANANYLKIAKLSIRALFPKVKSRSEKKNVQAILSSGASYQIRNLVLANPSLIGQTIETTFAVDDVFDQLEKGSIKLDVPESDRVINDKQAAYFNTLKEQGRIETSFNWTFFQAGDSREPEQAGIWGAIVGSALTLTITLLLAFPIGVATAIYLEEFAPKNWITHIIEVNINNLAAVPSIVFGLLGLAVFLNFFDMSRSAPVVGGMVLALMTLPTIIIAGRAALTAVPPSIREAATGLGASKIQVVFHHVLPLAMPGILTGSIIGMAQALGETAPLLMIGMVAFIVDIPGGFTDPATVMPVQVYLWSDSPERAFVERTSGLIMVMLAFLVSMNAAAVFLRKRFERKW